MSSNRHPARRVLALVQAEPWAITEAGLRQIIEIAARENRPIEAIEAERGQPLENTYRATVRDGIATIRMTGPLFRYANLFTAVSGATSMEMVAKDFTAAVQDQAVRGILLSIDSPGGTVSGTSELADLIYKARGSKPIHAHIDGLGASAAYWLASAADEVTASDTSLVGSIGVVMAEQLQDEPDVIEFVSSQSPNKRTSPMEELGRAQRQAIVDALGERFLEAVARHRGVEAEKVLADFGQGGVLVGAAAEAAGLIDGVSTYEQVHAALVEETSAARVLGAMRFSASGVTGRVAATPQEGSMTVAAKQGEAATLTAEQLAEKYPEQIASIRAAARSEGETAGKEAGKAEGRVEGIAAENARALAIEALAMPGSEAVITECKKDTACTKEMAAVKLVQAHQQKATTEAAANAQGRVQRLEALKGDESGIKAPPAQPSTAAAEGELAEVQRILATARALRPAAATTQNS
jgi:ClpP class serine protease